MFNRKDDDVKTMDVKTDGCKNNPKTSSTTKAGEHIPSSSSMPTLS